MVHFLTDKVKQQLLVSFVCAAEEMPHCSHCHHHRAAPEREEVSIADAPLQRTAASSETGRTSFVGSRGRWYCAIGTGMPHRHHMHERAYHQPRRAADDGTFDMTWCGGQLSNCLHPQPAPHASGRLLAT